MQNEKGTRNARSKSPFPATTAHAPRRCHSARTAAKSTVPQPTFVSNSHHAASHAARPKSSSKAPFQRNVSHSSDGTHMHAASIVQQFSHPLATNSRAPPLPRLQLSTLVTSPTHVAYARDPVDTVEPISRMQYPSTICSVGSSDEDSDAVLRPQGDSISHVRCQMRAPLLRLLGQ
jgi:hypothetical protein